MEKALLAGPFVGEFGWEILRFAPHIIWQKRMKYRDAKLIVLTRKERFDLYGRYANILVDLQIKGDYERYHGDCYALSKFPDEKYKKIIKDFYDRYSQKYNIVDHIYHEGPRWCNRTIFKEREYNFQPREENNKLVDNFLPNNKKKNIVLASRFRKGFPRNWDHWGSLFNMISKDKTLMQNFNFILCGKKGEYILDEKERFFDIQDITLNNNTSLVGVTIALLKKSVLTIGSQSGIPNLSHLVFTPTLQWGHEKKRHTVEYNITKEKVTFLECKNNKRFNDITPEAVFKKMKNNLKMEEEK